eukprot:6327847-Alexandrium_andersonii.AAC.1
MPQKRPWISPSTLELLATRKRLMAEGEVGQAEEIDKTIKKAFKGDRQEWVEERLRTSFWDP